jgi:hypothetical protein
LLLLQASPAAAYKWKRTIKVGIDHNGVPIQIDARAVGAGSTTGSPGGGGGGVPCRYHLASIGANGPYQQAPSSDALLYTIECGPWTDVRWLRVGANGQPLIPGATVDPTQLALSARDRLPLPAGRLAANPARSLVGLPTWFWYAGYDGRPLARTTTAFGVTVEVEARPTGYRWDFGDGTTMTSHDLGRPYPARSSITHTYQAARQAATVSCTFEFAVRWRTPGGAWTALPPLSRTATTTLPVAESQAVLGQ